MKLNKITFKWLVYHALHSNAAGQTELNIIKEIDEALEAGTLKIEDYSRDEWIKLDLNDPKTFPPKTNEYIVAIEGHSTSTTRKYSAEYLEFFAPEKITHWRPLPKPPVESEVCK